MSTILIFLVIIFFLLIHQSFTVQIARYKGAKNEWYYGALGLIPALGIYMAFQYDNGKADANKKALKHVFKTGNVFSTMAIYAELLILAVIVLVPVIYIIGTALTPTTGLPNTIWPENPSLRNFEFLLSGEGVFAGREVTTDFTRWYWNTLQIAFFTMIFAVLFITGTAYVFARYKFKGKKAGLMTILVLQMFPSFLALIAIFTLFDTFNLLDQPLALVIIYTAGAIPFNVWLIKGYLSGIPKELDESARIDGANKLQIFFKIILPLSVPIISFVAVTQFMAPWMDYILPSFVIRSEENWTLAVGIFAFINDIQRQNYPAFAASALLVAVPITILYVAFQRFLIEGITAGANKG
ncbi:MAG: sugar ABC transporter permease [Candidatus Izemoplasmataceae bacterium]